MNTFNMTILEQKFHSIEQFIGEIVKYDTFSDKMYETLKAKVGSFDEYFAMAPKSDAASIRFIKLKKQADSIYSILEGAHHDKDLESEPVAIGDHFKDDNSFPLSVAIKSELLAILNDKT